MPHRAPQRTLFRVLHRTLDVPGPRAGSLVLLVPRRLAADASLSLLEAASHRFPSRNPSTKTTHARRVPDDRRDESLEEGKPKRSEKLNEEEKNRHDGFQGACVRAHDLCQGSKMSASGWTRRGSTHSSQRQPISSLCGQLAVLLVLLAKVSS